MSSVTLSAKYQMVIPLETRQKLGLKRGQKLLVLEKGGIIYVVPERRPRDLAGIAPQLSHKDPRDRKDRY